MLHLFLALNVGPIAAALVALVMRWKELPTALAPRDFGLLSWLISAFAAAAAFWSVRDLFAWQRLRRASVSPL